MPDAPGPSARGVWRVVGLCVAAALGVAAVVVVVFAHTQRQQTVGLLIGLWGALIGFFLGPRRGAPNDDHAQLRQLELRHDQELQLEVTLRREIETALRAELSQLRNEVAALRGDVAERLNGQLKLERVETTRLIGSDLGTLEQQVRRLATAEVPAPTRHAAVLDAVTPSPQPASEQTSAFDRDPFAALPRLGPFVDADDAPPVDRPPEVAGPAERPTPEPEGYVGRRRADAHEHAAGHAPAPSSVAPGSGGRRRRADDEPNEVLARLLGH